MYEQNPRNWFGNPFEKQHLINASRKLEKKANTMLVETKKGAN
jgi:hypothetical protein